MKGLRINKEEIGDLEHELGRLDRLVEVSDLAAGKDDGGGGRRGGFGTDWCGESTRNVIPHELEKGKIIVVKKCRKMVDRKN